MKATPAGTLAGTGVYLVRCIWGVKSKGCPILRVLCEGWVREGWAKGNSRNNP
jgi:hypothetical protein